MTEPRLYLFKVSRDPDVSLSMNRDKSYNYYDSFIVCAVNAEQARQTQIGFRGEWVTNINQLKDLQVKLIGLSIGIKAGEIIMAVPHKHY